VHDGDSEGAPQRVGAEVQPTPVEVFDQLGTPPVLGHARLAAHGLGGEDLLWRLVLELQQRAAADVLRGGQVVGQVPAVLRLGQLFPSTSAGTVRWHGVAARLLQNGWERGEMSRRQGSDAPLHLWSTSLQHGQQLR